MIKYLVKSVSRATDANKNFKGVVTTDYIGKGDKCIGTDNPNLWHVPIVNNPAEIGTYWLDEYGYNRECDAKRCWSYKNPENNNSWQTRVEIVAVEY